MTAREKLFLCLVVGVVLGLGLLGWATGPSPAFSETGLDVTPTVENYLPYVVNAPAPTATPAPTPTATPPPAGWLSYLNNYRTHSQLPTVTENADWSHGDWLHARYMVKNDVIGHSEDPANPWYTPEGDAAAGASNVMVSSSATAPDEYAIDLWLEGPFHAVGMLDPALGQVGFGSYREADGGWQMGAALDVLRGLGAIPPTVSFPIFWPGDGATVPLRVYGGTETPDPLTGCPGYTAPSGLPLIVQIGPGDLTPAVTAHSFLAQPGDVPLEHCVFDETSYTNPDGNLQSLGRSVLSGRDAIVLIPRDPLTPGATYTASITANGQTHTWTFTVALSAQGVETRPGAETR